MDRTNTWKGVSACLDEMAPAPRGWAPGPVEVLVIVKGPDGGMPPAGVAGKVPDEVSAARPVKKGDREASDAGHAARLGGCRSNRRKRGFRRCRSDEADESNARKRSRVLR